MSLRRTRHRANRLVVALIGVELLAAALGGWRVLASHASAPQTVLHVGDATFKVIQTEQVSGLSNADLSGMSHGIPGLVKDDETLVRVSVTVSADGSATDYDPSRLLVYRSGSAVGEPPVGGSLTRGRLSAGGSLEAPWPTFSPARLPRSPWGRVRTVRRSPWSRSRVHRSSSRAYRPTLAPRTSRTTTARTTRTVTRRRPSPHPQRPERESARHGFPASGWAQAAGMPFGEETSPVRTGRASAQPAYLWVPDRAESRDPAVHLAVRGGVPDRRQELGRLDVLDEVCRHSCVERLAHQGGFGVPG